MRIALYAYSATKGKKTGTENYSLQLLNTLKSEHSIEAIVQTDRRIPIHQNLNQPHWHQRVRRFIEHWKIVKPAFNSIFFNYKRQIAALSFTHLEPKHHPHQLNDVYTKFTKLHLNPCIFDTIRFNYIIQKRKELVTIANVDGVDVFWLTEPFPMYMNNALNICTVHDAFINGTKPLSSNCQSTRRIKLEQVVRSFDLIFAVSAYTKQQLIDLFPGIEAEKIKVIYQALPEKARMVLQPQQQSLFLKQLGLQSKHYLLHVASMLPRKNQKNMVKAYLRAALDMPLILVGQKGKALDQELTALINKHDNVVWLEYLPDEQVNILYQHATAFIFPSFFEGFGIPILEAFYHQCPVLTASTSATPEIAGNAAVYVDPYSIEDISRGMIEISQNKAVQQQLINAGREQLKKFSDEAILKEINAALAEHGIKCS